VSGEQPAWKGELSPDAGHPGQLRIRVGDYHTVYEVHEDRFVVLVVAIGHRREIYRNL